MCEECHPKRLLYKYREALLIPWAWIRKLAPRRDVLKNKLPQIYGSGFRMSRYLKRLVGGLPEFVPCSTDSGCPKILLPLTLMVYGFTSLWQVGLEPQTLSTSFGCSKKIRSDVSYLREIVSRDTSGSRQSVIGHRSWNHYFLAHFFSP